MNAFFKAVTPYSGPIHYLLVLSALEDYTLPTNSGIQVKEYYTKHFYPWFMMEQQSFHITSEDPAWFLNYE